MASLRKENWLLFLRGLMRFIYPVHSIPAEYEIAALLKNVDRECADVDSNLYRLHFGQYFRFDIGTQLPFFYKCVQKMLVSICCGLSGLWQRTWPQHLSLTPFDPILIHRGSDDRRVDSLVATCAVLIAHGLVGLDDGGVVQQQYREVTQFFKRRWAFSAEELPVVEDIIALWMSYPHWERCGQLQQVIDLAFSAVVTNSYRADFVDDVNGALDPDELASSLHFVRSWFSQSFVGKSRRDLRGLLHVIESTDMQVSWLTDSVRAKLWDQLLKIGLDQTLSLCVSMLDNGPDTTVVPMVDEYRSTVLAQLNVMEVMATSPTRMAPGSKAMPSSSDVKAKRPRSQSDVKLKTSKKKPNVATVGTSKSTGRARGGAVSRRGHSIVVKSGKGRRIGGKLQAAKRLVLSVAAGEASDHGSQSSSDDEPLSTSNLGYIRGQKRLVVLTGSFFFFFVRLPVILHVLER